MEIQKCLILLLLFLLFSASQSANAVPRLQDQSYEEFRSKIQFYDVSESVALVKKLRDDFDKKYFVIAPNGEMYYTYPEGAYSRKVLEPYIRRPESARNGTKKYH